MQQDPAERGTTGFFRRQSGRRIALLVALGLAGVGGMIFWLSGGHLPSFDEGSVHAWVMGFGMAGPLALVALMVIAVVVSPIPSGPIAVAAGALYGTYEGAALSMAGAWLGANAAFCMARYLGHDALARSDNPVLRFIAAPHRQSVLMLIVFLSRLVPFISFDAVSYAAGLTGLSLWRFALATALGVAPVCLMLAAVGAGMTGEADRVMMLILLAGGVTLVPVAGLWLWARRSGATTK